MPAQPRPAHPKPQTSRGFLPRDTGTAARILRRVAVLINKAMHAEPPVLPALTTACVSGYFNPLTVGHLEYFRNAKDLVRAHGGAGKLLVIVNNDAQSCMKKGYTFMPEEERVRIVASLRDVDEVVLSVDRDRTVNATLAMLIADGRLGPHAAFCNAGDQTNEGVPERALCEAHGVRMVDGLGGKIQSSSWLIEGAVQNAARAARLV